MAHWFCRLYTLDTPNEKRRIEINCIFLYFAGIRRKGSYILFFFQKENMMILCFLIMVSLVQPLEDNYELFK